MSVSASALCTLVNLKLSLGITTATTDTLLEQAIDRATATLQRYCSRNFVSQRYHEWHDTQGHRRLVLKHNPIAKIRFIGIGAEAAITVGSTDASDIAATVSVEDTAVQLYRVASTGTGAATELLLSTYDSTVELAAQINATSGFSASTVVGFPSHYLRRRAAVNLLQGTGTLYAPSESIDEYTFDPDTGIIYGGLLRQPQSILVDYLGGYTTVPYDVEYAAIKLASRMFNSRQRDEGLSSESLGGYSYSLRGAAEIDADMRALLDPFKRLR